MSLLTGKVSRFLSGCLAGRTSWIVALVLTLVTFFMSGEAWAQDVMARAGENTANLMFGLSVGVMVSATLYLFFIWIVIRDKGQAFLMFLLLCLCINMAATNDGMMGLLGIYSPNMRTLLQNYSMVLFYVSSLFFTYYFLEMDVHAPQFRMPMVILSGILFLLLLVALVDPRMITIVLPSLGAVALGLVLFAGITALGAGVSSSFTHVISFLFFLLGGYPMALYDLGYIPDADTANYLTYLAYSIAALMFAIVIAGQFAARQEEKEKALEISNERFSLAARGSNEGLFDWNLLTGEAFFSDQFERTLGRSMPQSPEGFRIWMRLIWPSDRKMIFGAMRKFRENRSASTINLEYRVMNADRAHRWLHTKAVATRMSSSGQILRFVGSIGDITDRKRGEAALRASEARFRSITEAHPVPVLIARLQDMQIVYASPGSETLLGLPIGTIVSHKLSRFLPHPNERKEIMQAMTEAREVNLMEVSIAHGDGNTSLAELSARRINYQNEAALVIGLNDLTERKKAEAEVQKQKEALQQSEKMAALGGLLAGVAHELNNPLSVVMGQTTLLMETAGDDRTKSRGDKIFKAADRCSRIVKSFLALARRKPPEHKPVDVNAVISASLELLGYQFRNENVNLKLQLEPALPPIIGDSDQLTQVFTNLALNAAQAMHEWTGEHNLTISTQVTVDGMVEVLVSDTGPGIPDALKNRVFEPFFSTKGTGGTGVGLALCLNIIETHGGRLTIEDTQGSGATFRIKLPNGQDALQLAVSKTEGGDALVQSASKPVQANVRILIVDDEIELAQTLADLLEPEGHYIDLAANGAIALDKLRKKKFDVIISDLRMPVLDGPGLYAELGKSLPEYLQKIIYVTGDTLSPHVHAFLSENPVPVIEKPYRLADVKLALAKIVAQAVVQGAERGEKVTV